MNKHYSTTWGEPFAETTALPFSPLLPTDKIGLMKWRIYVRERCLHDKEFRDIILQMCEMDCIFFIQTFIFFHETRATEENIGIFPVILDPDQKDVLAVFQKYVGKIDGTVDKTRGIGLSFILDAFCLWLWLFSRHRIEIGLVSKDDMSLDMKGRPTTLMGKLDVMFEYLPAWMRLTPTGETVLHRTHTNHRFEHKFNKNTIQGYTSSDEKLRSARLWCCFVDEAAFLDVSDQRFLASAYGTSPSMWWISTHNGRGSLFHRLCNNALKDLIRVSIYWWNNRRCRAGLYKSVNGRIEILDTEYKYPADYPFSHDFPGKLRSPTVDRAFNRPEVDPQVVFEEWYGVAALDSRQLIQQNVLTAIRPMTTPPLTRGHIDLLSGEFIDDPLDGPIYMWHDPMTPFTGRYVMGLDPSLGIIDAANAGLSVFDTQTGKQVISAALEGCSPADLAQIAVHLAKLICGTRSPGCCTIIYESTGINAAFAVALEHLNWPMIYNHREGQPGIPNNDRGMAWLMELGRALFTREAAISDLRIVDDLPGFEVENDTLKLLYTGNMGHGDLSMATAIAWWGAREARKAVLSREKERKELVSGIRAEPLLIERAKRRLCWSSKFDN